MIRETATVPHFCKQDLVGSGELENLVNTVACYCDRYQDPPTDVYEIDQVTLQWLSVGDNKIQG